MGFVWLNATSKLFDGAFNIDFLQGATSAVIFKSRVNTCNEFQFKNASFGFCKVCLKEQLSCRVAYFMQEKFYKN